MSSDGTGERLPNGLPAEFTHAHMTGNLIQGTFADAPHWAEPDPNWAGFEQQTINICIDHPELGVRVLGHLTLGGDVDPVHHAQPALSGEPAPATPDDGNRRSTTSTTDDNKKPGYTPEMQAAYDDFKRIEPGASDQYIDELIRYRFRDGTDRVASINRLLHFKDDVQKQRERIDAKDYDVSYEAIKQALSDPHNYLFAASFAPSLFGSAAMFLDGALYQYQGDQESATGSYAAAMLGIVTGDSGLAKLGVKGAGKLLNEGGHAAEAIANAGKAEKLATKGTAEAEKLAEKESSKARAANPERPIGAADFKPEDISKEAGGQVPELHPHPTESGVGAPDIVRPGSFSISDWSAYPVGVPRPQGPFRIVEGDEYSAARVAANKANVTIRREQGLGGKPVDVHEIQPIKFGGDPSDPANKMVLPRDLHRQTVTPWWNQLQRDLE